jgi:hypothetical protein
MRSTPDVKVCAFGVLPVVIEPFFRLRSFACAAISEREELLICARGIPSAQLIDESALPLFAAVTDQPIMSSPGMDFSLR